MFKILNTLNRWKYVDYNALLSISTGVPYHLNQFLFHFHFFKQEDGMRREHGQFYCGARYYCPASFCLSRTGFNMAAVPGDARASLLVPSCVIRVSSGWDHSDPGEKAGKGMEVVRIFCYRVLDWSASFIHPNFSLHPQVWSSPSTPPPFR